MFFSTKTILSTLALALGASAVAVQSEEIEKRDITSLLGLNKCPTGSYPFEVISQATICGTSSSKVWSYMGDFSSVKWQGFEKISTSGIPNFPFSSRTFLVPTLGVTLTEDLTLSIGGTQGSPLLTSYYQIFGIRGTASVPALGLSASSVRDLLWVYSSGKDTKMWWKVQGCASGGASAEVTVGTAQAVFQGAHQGALNGTILYFGGSL